MTSRTTLLRRLVFTLVAVLGLTATSPARTPDQAVPGPVPPITSAGRWFLDAEGRVVLFHGVNEVAKRAPYHPAAFGFGDDDAAFLADEGFNVLRLGVDLRGLLPVPGTIDDAYVEALAGTVATARAHGLFVLIDFHQDGFAPMFNGNGFPDWMAITDGLANPPDAVFPLYYIQNPAMQRAFDHFWWNSPGPLGLGLQEHVVRGLERIATRFAGDPMVLGYELMNEPWPGTTWQPCVAPPAGCPDLEAERLTPFYRLAGAAARAIAPEQLVFVEPFVLFNFGLAGTTMPGTDPGVVLSFHSYAVDRAGEEAVVRLAVEAAERDGAPLIETEFGATADPAVLERLAGQADARIVPWIFWAYGEQMIHDQTLPPAGDNLRAAAVDALTRPYPMAVTGVPTRVAFDPASNAFELAYTTGRPGGGRYGHRVDTVVFVPPRHYPDGYRVEARGAQVTSKPCAGRLTLRSRHSATQVSVRVTPLVRRPGARRTCP